MKAELRQPYKQFFGTLDNQIRIDIIESLIKKPLNVTQICIHTKLNQSTVSHSLKRLELCGFVFSEKVGKEKYYTLNNDTIKPLLTLMHKHMKNYCSKICHTH